MTRNILSAIGAALALSMSALPASAQRTEVGILDCIIEGGADIAIITSRELSCTFQPSDGTRPPETYVGVINRFGLEVGVTGERVLQWLVVAPTAESLYAPGALSGTYVGPSAEITAGVGGGANVLISERDNTLMLQPLSVQAQTGLNLAVGVSSFQLHPTAL